MQVLHVFTCVCYVFLSACTVNAKETKEPNNRVLLKALLFGCIVSFVVRNLSLWYLQKEPI